MLREDQAVRLTVESYMPLSVERIDNFGDGRPLVAIAHTAVQNGDLMHDPELVFELFEHPASPPAGTRLVTRAAWNKKHRDYRSFIDGTPHMLDMDPATGATVLIPVCVVERFAEPISFRNDFPGILNEVYTCDDDGRRTHVRPALKADLRSFARTWFRNLRAQGFLGRDARHEVLA